MTPLFVDIIPVLQDNYTYVVRTDDHRALVIDPGEAGPVLEHITRETLRVESIINTHHHSDHIAGNAAILAATGAQLAAPASETNRIDHITHPLSPSAPFLFAGHAFTIFETPGHTRGHICLYAEDAGLLFTGDTLFSMGCGRLFEGSAQEMFSSLQTLKALPDDTLIYCGHEYTLGNGAFAMKTITNSGSIFQRMETVKELLKQGRPSIPVTLGTEKETNPFLRAKTCEEFSTLRAQKDGFS